jgi:hypothetical protein
VQDLIEAKLKDRRAGDGGNNGAYVEQLEEENARLREGGGGAATGRSGQSGAGAGAGAAAGGGASDDAKDATIKALEEQMIENAVSFANDLSELKTKIFEYEMGGGGGGSDDDDDDDDDDSGGGGNDNDDY